MKGKSIAKWCEYVSLPTEKLAEELQISHKTLIKWRDDDSEISQPYAHYIRVMFRHALLQEPLRKIAENSFKIVPSEYICVWFVAGSMAILLKDIARHQFFNGESPYFNPEIMKDLRDEKSMTVNSLRTGEIFNLTYDAIRSDKNKLVSNTMSSYLQDGICHSLLKIPIMDATARGPGAFPIWGHFF
jgi:hypothetical protein